MQKIDNVKNHENLNSDIELADLFRILLDGKKTLILLTTIFSIIGIIYSLTLPNIYESQTLLDSTSSTQNASPSPVGSYNSLVNVAGLRLPNQSYSQHAFQAFTKLKTLSFFENHILPNIYLPDLMAFKSWDSSNNLLEYDDSIFDTATNKWIRDFSYPQNQKPSAQESYEVFKKNHLSVDLDDKSGFLTLKIRHQSPLIAAQWAKLIIDEINDYYRKKDKLEAEIALNYLNSRMEIVKIEETRQAIASLMLKETQTLTLIEANEFYVYEIIDPPAIAEKKSEPNRALICFFAAIFGAMLSFIYLLARHFKSI